ncbi:hypothetical protein [Chondromyces apiculatus]|uniref:IMS import disulfide relay-system CHCH-CHCH-like Cx9C domain-containing protein n=1 Tax=Chondromyces apiculatus DSM 436 TaxID=1192034 RepID=A0A017STX0_9BACT|nr:hypothetical protein [Chondromyces apiculatus]EYF00433.1 Hypothetical protein CAP_0840 [Chondromyces apiculatus DSM 436]
MALGLLATACGPSVEDLCEILDDDCEDMPYEACVDDGERLESRAESSGCEEPFEAYLDCIDDETCEWNSRCAYERDALVACTGESAW